MRILFAARLLTPQGPRYSEPDTSAIPLGNTSAVLYLPYFQRGRLKALSMLVILLPN